MPNIDCILSGNDFRGGKKKEKKSQYTELFPVFTRGHLHKNLELPVEVGQGIEPANVADLVDAFPVIFYQ